MKIDPYYHYQRQKSSPMTLVSGNMRIFAVFLWVVTSNDSEFVEDGGNFWRFGWLLLWNC